MYPRTSALAYVQGTYATFSNDTGIATTDTVGGYKGVLDSAYRVLGVVQGDLPTATVEDIYSEKLEALLDYFALVRFQREYATKVSVSKATPSNSVSKQRNQAYNPVKDAVLDALKRCKGLGVSPVGGGFQWGRYNEDFLEPEPWAEGLGIL